MTSQWLQPWYRIGIILRDNHDHDNQQKLGSTTKIYPKYGQISSSRRLSPPYTWVLCWDDDIKPVL